MKYLQTTTINGVVIGQAVERPEEDVLNIIQNMPMFENDDRKIDIQNENGNYIVTVTIKDCGKIQAKLEAMRGDNDENQN